MSPFAEIAVFCNPKVRIAHPRISRRSGAERPGYRPTATRVLHATNPSSSGFGSSTHRLGRGPGGGLGGLGYQLPPLHQPPYPPRAGAVYPLSFPQQKSRGDISNYCTLPGTGPALPLSVRCDSGSLGMEEDDLLQPGDQAGARPVRQRGLVGHRLAVAPQQLVQVAPPRRVAEVRMCELVSLLRDPARAVIVQPA